MCAMHCELFFVPLHTRMEKKIGFDQIKSMLADNCQSNLGRENIDALTWTNDVDVIRQRQDETHEMQTLIATLTETPEMSFYDLREVVKHIRIEGTYILEEDMYHLYLTLVTMHGWLRLIRRDETNMASADTTQQEATYPTLERMAHGVFTFHAVEQCAAKILDKHGHIKDEASPSLARVRSELRKAEGSVSRTLQSILHSIKEEGLVEADTNPTLRDGRLVIPVSPSIKRRLGGIVHDESATGKTVYVEPQEVVEANNRIRELEAEEKREIIRILQHFTSLIRPNVKELTKAFVFLGQLEFVMARVFFAKDINGICPRVSSRPIVDWTMARHPLLERSLNKQERKIVPLDILLDKDGRILIISGPNAGGKSVCLKTVGLIQYMIQCGLPVPLGENSKCGVFSEMYIDIGDDQSIENDLSTYSSHLLTMKRMMKAADNTTLLLIDEMGSGTEPTIGGAMAEAILERFHAQGAWAVITTHYQNLKHFAENHKGVRNGAMLYDRQKMEALFQLQIGNPGSSFAIEIARKIGIPADVIQRATSIVGQEYVSADKYLLDIVRDKRYWEDKRQNIHEKEKRMEATIMRYEEKIEGLRQEQKEILHSAREEAKEIVSRANAAVEHTIKEIREAQAEKQRTREARESLAVVMESLTAPAKKVSERIHQPKKQDTQEQLVIAVGKYARIKGATTVGRIDRIDGKKVMLTFGHIHTMTTIDRIEAAKPPKQDKQPSGFGANHIVHQHNIEFSTELDIRGQRADEALNTLMHYMDDALMTGATRVRILHGTGTGALRELCRHYMQTVPRVISVRDEDVRFGGAGITVVEMK